MSDPALQEKIIGYLRQYVTPARFNHIMGTARIARTLAKLNGIPCDKAELSALLHDAGKDLSDRDLVSYVKKHRIAVPDRDLLIRHHPSLLHSFVSAHIAREVFRVTDRDVLDAIALHTVGAIRMSTLAKIIYLADAVAPDRKYRGVRKLRALCRKNLDEALLTAIANKITYVVAKRQWLHPLSVEIWNELLREAEGK